MSVVLLAPHFPGISEYVEECFARFRQPAVSTSQTKGAEVVLTTHDAFLLGALPVTAGLSIDSTVYAVDARHRILWGGPAHGITGVHEWTFAEDGDGVVVRTRESWAGGPVDADRDNLAAALDDSLTGWLDALKKAAE